MPSLLINQTLVFGLAGGLGLFLFGMKTLSEGLQKIAGDRLRRILGTLTDNRVVGMLVGMSVTAMIQSSTATTVMVVGFVNAGLMSLLQAIGVVLGANIGTTVTAQLIAFNVARFALPAIGLGVGLKLFARRTSWNYAGEVLLGLGLVFYGLLLMKGAFDPLRDSQEIRQILLAVGTNPVWGVLVGALLTVVVQSSSATIGLTIALASSGLIGFEASLALILGENIGTTVTANLAAVGSNLAARRAAFAHFLFNAIGVCYMLLLFPWFLKLTTLLSPGDPDFVVSTAGQVEQFGAAIGDKPFIARHIANAHTLFNLVNAIIFLPLVGHLARLTTVLIPGRADKVEFHLRYLDLRVLDTPPIALSQARAETGNMFALTGEVLADTLTLLQDQNLQRIASLQVKERQVDLLQKEITDFLVALSQRSVTGEVSQEVAALMHMVNDLERVADHCMHLVRLVQRKLDQRIDFSDKARREIAEIAALTGDFFAVVGAAMASGDAVDLAAAQQREDAIDRMEESLRNNHIARLNTGECTVNSGLIYIDMLHGLEKIGDHTFKLARALSLQG